MDTVSCYRSSDLQSTPLDGARDVRYGQRYQDAKTGQWVEQWNIDPYNMAEATMRSLKADGSEVPLFFAPATRHLSADTSTAVTCAFVPVSVLPLPATAPAVESRRH